MSDCCTECGKQKLDAMILNTKMNRNSPIIENMQLYIEQLKKKSRQNETRIETLETVVSGLLKKI